jgi:glutaredoxin 2
MHWRRECKSQQKYLGPPRWHLLLVAELKKLAEQKVVHIFKNTFISSFSRTIQSSTKYRIVTNLHFSKQHFTSIFLGVDHELLSINPNKAIFKELYHISKTIW